MREFRDLSARSWAVNVTVGAVERARTLAGLDLLAVVGGDVLERLYADPVALGKALYAVCLPEAKGRGLDEEAFLESLAGDVLDAARKALVASIADFSPSRREAVLRLSAAMAKMHEAADAAARRFVESGELERRMDEALATAEQPPANSGS